MFELMDDHNEEAVIKVFGCDGVAGGGIFKDTLYGGGTGLLLGGLYVVSQDSDDKGKIIANSALGGAGLGLVLGIVEVSVRDCYEPSRQNASLQPFWGLDGGYGLSFSYEY